MLSVYDILAIALTFAISLAIGVYFKYAGNKQKTTTEFLMAGRNTSPFPVVLSLIVTKSSGIAMLGIPAETYLYGCQRIIADFACSIGIILAAYVFIPIYFAIDSPTVFTYLKRRYGDVIKSVITVLYYVQTCFYMAVALYVPALALSVVTNLSTETSIVITGVVSTIYSTLGGLKAVLWTDVFQALMMYICLIAITFKGVAIAGGFKKLLSIADEGGRIEFFNFTFDMNTRYTFWNTLFFGITLNLYHCGVNQTEVQRLLAVKNLKKSQTALLCSIGPGMLLGFLTQLVGIVAYATFSTCDPVTNKEYSGIYKPDQIIPYFIMTHLSSIPGVAGLCISGIFSGSLSSLSSAVNSLSAVALEDFIRPFVKSRGLSDVRFVLVAKLLVILNGAIFMTLAFLISKFQSIVQAITTANGAAMGPVLGVFVLGVLTKTANQKGTLIGLLIGVLFSSWIGFGSAFSGEKHRPLSLSTTNCTTFNDTAADVTYAFLPLSICSNNSCPLLNTDEKNTSDVFPLHRISFMWVITVGLIVSVITGFIGSKIFEWREGAMDVDSILLSPVVKTRKKEIKFSVVSKEKYERETCV